MAHAVLNRKIEKDRVDFTFSLTDETCKAEVRWFFAVYYGLFKEMLLSNFSDIVKRVVVVPPGGGAKGDEFVNGAVILMKKLR